MSGVPAPKPLNLDAMTAAYQSGDPIAIAREKAVYNQQLVDAGCPPLYEVIDYTEPQREDHEHGY